MIMAKKLLISIIFVFTQELERPVCSSNTYHKLLTKLYKMMNKNIYDESSINSCLMTSRGVAKEHIQATRY